MRLAILEPAGNLPPGGDADRLAPELAARLAGAGQEVTLLAAGPSRVAEGVAIVRRRSVARGLLERLGYDEELASAPAAAWTLTRARFDVAHAFSPADAWAAVKARRLGGPPVVFSLLGRPSRRCLVSRRHRLPMLLAATEGAACVTVPSAAAAAAARRYLLREPEVVAMPLPVEGAADPRGPAAVPPALERIYDTALKSG